MFLSDDCFASIVAIIDFFSDELYASISAL